MANTIVSNDDDGIYFQSGAEGTVEGNDIHSNRLAQIRVDPGSKPTIGYNNHEPRSG
jgi:parallel beta-helix repeat protein